MMVRHKYKKTMSTMRTVFWNLGRCRVSGGLTAVEALAATHGDLGHRALGLHGDRADVGGGDGRNEGDHRGLSQGPATSEMADGRSSEVALPWRKGGNR